MMPVCYINTKTAKETVQNSNLNDALVAFLRTPISTILGSADLVMVGKMECVGMKEKGPDVSSNGSNAGK